MTTVEEPGQQQPSHETSEETGEVLRKLVQEVRGRFGPQRPIIATYRLQFHGQFRFEDAAPMADYLARLGVSHVYSSPQLQARSGSTHGYDVVDHSRLNPDLGDEAAYNAYCEALERNGLGQILDIVPNHMSVAGDENGWWMDVLTHGPASRYAAFFDIDWQPVKRELEGKVLLPVLGDVYGKALEAGQFQVNLREGAFYVTCNDSQLPLDPRTWPRILSPRLATLTESNEVEDPSLLLEFESIISNLQSLPDRSDVDPERMKVRHRESVIIQGRLKRLLEQSPRIARHVEENLATLNGTQGQPESFDELDRLLGDQAYHLVLWRAGSDEMNYRRFFDVTELAAICTENLDVFEASHKLVLNLAVQRKVDGFRIDHIDGLFDPAQYLWRLQWSYVRELGRDALSRIKGENAEAEWSRIEADFLAAMHAEIGGPAPANLFLRTRDNRSPQPGSDSPDAITPPSGPAPWHIDRCQLPLYVLVEKILGEEEHLSREWPVAGTTGYDSLNQLNGLFVSAAGMRELDRQYARFVDLHEDFREIVYSSKRLILSGPMQSELQLLAHRLDRLSYRHRRSRDFTLLSLRAALREIIACFSVYRTYVCDGAVSEFDRQIIQRAVAQARRRNRVVSSAVFDFVRDVLLLEQPPQLDPAGRLERDFFIGRFQQVTSPVMAKGVEDTAFYRYFPLASIDEVGGHPLRPVMSVEDYHHHNRGRQAHWPQTMLAGTTHDTKRSEDVRARLNSLSGIPMQWRSAVFRWSRWNRRHRRELDGQQAPSRNDEWLFYQTLAGVWPLKTPTAAEREELIKRLQAYLEKATHEAKLRTSWLNPHPQYDEAVRNFVADVLRDPQSRFLADFEEFHNTFIDNGLYTAVSQTLLRLTCPGVPDVYQGQETWDFSLVDPDNRRPVDYARRQQLLDEVIAATQTPEARLDFAREVGRNPRDERMKLFVTWTALQFRKSRNGFEGGTYLPVECTGLRGSHACAFAWSLPGGETVLILAPRLIPRLTKAATNRLPYGAVWADTGIATGPLGLGRCRELFTGQVHEPGDGQFSLATVLKDFPVAILVPDA